MAQDKTQVTIFFFSSPNSLTINGVPHGEIRCGSVDLLTFALDCWRRFEHVPQRFVTRVTVGRHVVMHRNKLMPHIVDSVHSVLKQS